VEDDLSHVAVEVAARQGAYHQVVVDDDHQSCHYLVVEVAYQDA
jgi:hypothetical protein